MATTTTNFGWDIPQSTDLVKDGATAIAALGQDIDTAFVDFKGGTTGQVLKKTSGTDLDVEWGTPSSGLTLINTTSFSGVASQSVNDVFTATYRNYKIILNVNGSVDGTICRLKLRASGTDSSASYYFGLAQTNSAGTVAGSNGNNVTTGWTLTNIRNSATARNTADVTLYSPQLAIATNYTVTGAFDNGAIVAGHAGGGTHDAGTAYDGFTLLASSGNITGVVYVYGLAV